MKYIRTKDKLFELHILDNGSKFIKKGNLVAPLFEADEKYITKEADTIDELCDVFVIEDKDDFGIYHSLQLAKHIKGTLFGAIWTDKGLQFVARMNSKGVLELI